MNKNAHLHIFQSLKTLFSLVTSRLLLHINRVDQFQISSANETLFIKTIQKQTKKKNLGTVDCIYKGLSIPLIILANESNFVKLKKKPVVFSLQNSF